MTNSPNSSANNEVWWTEGSWTGVVTPRAVMILPPSVPQDLTERLWRLLRSEEASLTRALDELVMGMGGRLGAIPDFVLAVSAPEDVFHVALRGAPQMEVDGKALDASAVTTWFETTVTAPNSVIVSAPDGAGQVRRPAVDAVVSTGHLVLRGSEKSSGTPSPSRASSKGSGDSDDDDPDPAGPDYSTASAGSAGTPAAAVRTSRSSRRASRRASRRQSASSDHSEQDDSSEGAPAETAESADVVDDLIEIAQDNAEQQALDGAELAASLESAEAAVVAEATAVAEAAAQAHAEEEPVRSGDHDGQTINSLPDDLSQELRAELLNQGLGPLEPSQSAEVVESPESAAVDAAMVEFVQPSGGEPATAELGRGDHDGQTINGLPEDLVGELVSLVGTGPSSPASPVSASSPSEPDAIRIVLSAVCPQGHPNPTNYTVCRVCGAELNRPAKSVACPPLGRVVTSGGESIELNRPLLVGRNPVADDISSVAEVPLRPLTVASPNQLVSRNHILIDLDAWSVLAQDLGNCNGTVLNRQNEAPVRLSSANPVLLRSGDVLDLGDGQTLAFENLP